MSAAERRLLDARRARDQARSRYDARLEQVKADLSARGVGSRVAHMIGAEANEALEIGRDVARENKGVVAGTIAAVLLWLFKEPLAAAIIALGGAADDGDSNETQEEERERIHEQA